MTGGHGAAVLMAFLAFPDLCGAQIVRWPGDPPQPGAAAPSPAWPGEKGAPSPMIGGPRPAPMNGGVPCLAEFARLRGEVEKKGMAAKAASQKKVAREEMCKHITSYAEAEAMWVKHTETNAQACGIPIQIVDQLKQVRSNTEQTKQRICSAGGLSSGAGSLTTPNNDARLLLLLRR
jgi:hypothetical protein